MNDRSLKFFSATAPKKAVTVVAHGLNNKPSVMLPLVHYLNQLGSDVYLLKLFGHRSDGSSFKELDGNTWSAEAINTYNNARAHSHKHDLPLYFLGYSLGALIGQYMIFSSNGTRSFQRQVLLAPATALRRSSELLKTTSMLPGHWKLPSFTPRDYQANEAIHINAYKILFALEAQIKKGNFANLNLPTLLIMDQKDELVSYRRLKKYIARYSLTEYRMLTLDPSMDDRATKYHHLILDQPSMGSDNWELSKKEIREFLFPAK